MTPTIWDVGLQNERTTLAWSRSALSLLGCGLLTARLALEWHWIAATTTLVLSALSCAVLQRGSRLRYLTAAAALSQARPLPDGRQGASLAGCVLALGLLALVVPLGHLLGAIVSR